MTDGGVHGGGTNRPGLPYAPDSSADAARLIEQLGWGETIDEALRSSEERLSDSQLCSLEQLPDGHSLLGVRDGVPLVSQADGQLLRMQRDGSLVVAHPVATVRSYRHVEG